MGKVVRFIRKNWKRIIVVGGIGTISAIFLIYPIVPRSVLRIAFGLAILLLGFLSVALIYRLLLWSGIFNYGSRIEIAFRVVLKVFGKMIILLLCLTKMPYDKIENVVKDAETSGEGIKDGKVNSEPNLEGGGGSATASAARPGNSSLCSWNLGE